MAASILPASHEPPIPPGVVYRVLTNPRSRYLLLQSLVSIILSYELLFGSQSVISRLAGDGLVVSLWLLIPIIAVFPVTWLETVWFSTVLVALDTLLVTAAIYLSGNARSDLYIAYFVLMLVAASVRRLSQLLTLSLLLSLGYAAVLYESVLSSGALTVGHLLGVPVLMVMAIFYGVALETITAEQTQKSRLQQDVETLRKNEDRLAVEKSRLECRIADLKGGLVQADRTLREGLSARQAMERRLQDAQKMEAVGQIAAGMAHQFSFLLSVIGKQTGLLLSRMKADDPLRSSVEDLFRSGGKAAALTAELLALNVSRTPMRHIVSVRKVLVELEPAIRSVLPPEIELRVLADDSPAYAEVDREGLEQVVLQVVVNGRDAMPAGGRLTVEVRTEDRSLPDQGPGISQVMIVVRDCGTGMSRDTQARIFEPFFSTKETNIGLGLTAVYGTVKQNGGMLAVESRPGQGTVVQIFFPGAASADVREEPLAKTLLAKGDETILLVNEDEIDRKLAASVLARHHYAVLEAASSTEAMLVSSQHRGSVQLAVSPLLMPEIEGRDLARQLMIQHPAMKALFVSSYDEEAMHHHRINRKFVLHHPYRQAGLVEKVREILDAA